MAIQLMHKDVLNQWNEISKQKKRIEINQEEMERYKQDLINMQKQLDIYHDSLGSIRQEHFSEMKSHQLNTNKTTDKIKETKKKNMILRSRFDKYRKTMSLETRLIELEKKIQAAWKRDEIWVGIRDWGLLSLLLFSFLICLYYF